VLVLGIGNCLGGVSAVSRHSLATAEGLLALGVESAAVCLSQLRADVLLCSGLWDEAQRRTHPAPRTCIASQCNA
jgi:hypothetical protein